MSKDKFKEELENQVKQIKKLSREEELASGVHRFNAAGPMEDKKKKKEKYKARGKYRNDEV